MKALLLIIFTLMNFKERVFANDRRPSFPFITGDGFRSISTHIFDETGQNFQPSDVQQGDTIFVKSDFINFFYENIHPKISSDYILITHNSDLSASSACRGLLEEETLIAWLAQNAYEVSHPKLIPIPIGLENRYNQNGDPSRVEKAIKRLSDKAKRNIFIYMNFNVATCPQERGEVFSLFKDRSYVISSPKSYSAFLRDLSRTNFVLCPRGNGFDCHRTWEALLMGAIPIVKSSFMDPLFESLPVLIVKDYRQLEEEFLQKKYQEIRSKPFDKRKLTMDYWIEILQKLSNKARDKCR